VGLGGAALIVAVLSLVRRPPAAPIAAPIKVQRPANVAPRERTEASLPTGPLAPAGPVAPAAPRTEAALVAPAAPSPGRRPGAPSREVGTSGRRAVIDARKLLAAGRYDAARQAFSRLLDGRDRPAALLGLGEIAFQQSNYPEALRLGRSALLAGAGIPARVLLGNASFKLGRYSDAVREYQAVLREKPAHSEARRGLEAAERRQAGR
jgi:tetratricopeptide (TPR) repeat protein